MTRTLLITAALSAPFAAAAESTPLESSHIVRVESSSVAELRLEGRAAFTTRHLTDGRDWSTWGSRPDDREGAWLRLEFDTTQYVSGFELIPGTTRDRAAFNQCGRPARIRVVGAADEEVLTLSDKRVHSLSLTKPLPAKNLRLIIEDVHGKSVEGGVCISDLKVLVAKDPLAAIPDLDAQLREALLDLGDDHRAKKAHQRLLAFGPLAIPALLKAVDTGNPNQAERVIRLLGALGDRRALAVVAPIAQNSASPELKRAALWALAALQSPEHFGDVQAWYARAGSDRDEAFEALALTGDARALPAIIQELVRGNEHRRAAALAHLGRFGQAGVDAISPLLTSEDTRERAAALLALGAVPHPEAEAHLKAGLMHADGTLRAAAIRGITAQGSRPDILDQLRSRWQSRHADEREAVAELLAKRPDAESLELLELLTGDTSLRVREAAARSLAHHDSAKARELLTVLSLYGPDGGTALAAAEGLLTESAPVSLMVRLLSTRHREVKALTAKTLGDRGQEGLNGLVDALLGEDPSIRTAAVAVLEKQDARVVPLLLAAAPRANAASTLELIRLLGHFEEPTSVGYLAAQLANAQDLTVRTAAIDALRRCAPADQAAPSLLAAMDDQAIEVRVAAVSALGQLKVSDAKNRLISLLDAEEPEIRRAAIRSLGHLRDRSLVPILAKAYQDRLGNAKEASVREELVVAIGRIGGQESQPLLFEAMNDADVKVRVAASQGLR